MIEWGGLEKKRAPDKRGGKGQPPLQLMPCSGEEEEEGRKYKETKGNFHTEEEQFGPSDKEKGE